MDNFVVFGLAGMLVVKRIVDGLKKLGMDKKWGIYAAFAVALVLATANEAAALSPVFLLWYQRVAGVLLIAFSASELYDAQRSLRANGN